MKILNLYACLGGNRYKWNEVADNLEITAVEIDPEAARLYSERFPHDTVIIADAHEYLVKNFQNFDFIWSSPPCPTHSRLNSLLTQNGNFNYPDLKLYEEIIFLKTWFKGKYCVENVIPYYEPLIPGQIRGRHMYWTNFLLPHDINERKNPDLIRTKKLIHALSKYHDYDFYQYNGKQNRKKMARNLVDYEAGKTILEVALNCFHAKNTNQLSLFENV